MVGNFGYCAACVRYYKETGFQPEAGPRVREYLNTRARVLCTRKLACVRACAHACVRVPVRACAHTLACVHALACVSACVMLVL